MLTRLLKRMLFGFSILLLSIPAFPASVDTLAGIKNFKTPAANTYSGGQASEAQFTALAEAGVKHVINLRPASEMLDFKEPALVEGKGMRYHVLPVSGLTDLKVKTVKRLEQILQQVGEEKAFFHCSSGNRVGAVMALRAALMKGENKTAALTLGRNWGLTRWEPEIQRLLEIREYKVGEYKTGGYKIRK